MLRKKFVLEPVIRQSKSGTKSVEKVLLVDDGYPETLIHLDCFYDNNKPGLGNPHGEIYDRLRAGETLTVWFTMMIEGEDDDE